MSFYEVVFIARQDLAVSQVESLTETYTKLIKDLDGEVKDSEYWGLKYLAYPIRKNRRGHYVMLRMKAPGKAIEEIRRQMRINEDVLRNLIVRVDALEEGPSAMMRQAKYKERDRDYKDRDYNEVGFAPAAIEQDLVIVDEVIA
jgi:small subunit ribosomal protein S6